MPKVFQEVLTDLGLYICVQTEDSCEVEFIIIINCGGEVSWGTHDFGINRSCEGVWNGTFCATVCGGFFTSVVLEMLLRYS